MNYEIRGVVEERGGGGPSPSTRSDSQFFLPASRLIGWCLLERARVIEREREREPELQD